jgi:hypothetical protein
MPLTRASEQPVFRRDEICFLMEDGAEEVICTVSTRVLLAFGDTVSNAVLIFRAYREEIERAASEKYDRSAREPYEILRVSERDLCLGPGLFAGGTRGRPGPGSLRVEQMQREHFACHGCSQGLTSSRLPRI